MTNALVESLDHKSSFEMNVKFAARRSSYFVKQQLFFNIFQNGLFLLKTAFCHYVPLDKQWRQFTNFLGGQNFLWRSGNFFAQ